MALTNPHNTDKQSVNYEDLGVQFKVISPDMYEDVMDFLWTHFFPAAPISRSLGITRHWLLDRVWTGALQDNCSIAALDRSGNILAVRVGSVKERTNWGTWLVDKMMKQFPFALFSRFLTPFLQKMPVYMHLTDLLNYDVWTKFALWNCDLIYEVRTSFSAPLTDSPLSGSDGLLCPVSRDPRSGLGGREEV